MICIICQANGCVEFMAKEMQFGTREEFLYAECINCGCVQIVNTPEDIGKYYPEKYYSFRSPRKWRNFRGYIDTLRLRDNLHRSNLFGRFLNSFLKPLDYVDLLRETGLDENARILDFGCGSGKSLHKMAFGGFPLVIGLDPYIERDIYYANGAKIYKDTLENFSTKFRQLKFDLIKSDSFEHMSEPILQLKFASSLLSENGWIVIVLPVADSNEWKEYRENWHHLDAPRHFYLHTQNSIEVLCSQLNLKLDFVKSYGSYKSILASELYRKDVPFIEQNEVSCFDQIKIEEFKELSRVSNSNGKGALSAFYIRKSYN
jgi:SAM-dependent methyltransferase